MTGIRRATMLGTAAALVTLSLAMPAAANDVSRSAGRMTDVSSSEIPLPKARPAMLRKRFAVRLPAYRAWPARPVLPAYERVVVRWSMLMLGIGF